MPSLKQMLQFRVSDGFRVSVCRVRNSHSDIIGAPSLTRKNEIVRNSTFQVQAKLDHLMLG